MHKVSIEYSIVSRGTEKYSNCGYMAISNIFKFHRYILNVDHNVTAATLNNDSLRAKSCYEIYNVVFSRLQLITALMFEKSKNKINDNILILGIGNIGIGCIMYLLDNGFKSISICVKKSNEMIIKLLEEVKKNYNININVIYNLKNQINYNTYIDTTGSSLVLKNIFESAHFNNTIVILSTPRDDCYLISPLMINRKNLTVIGGHELNGIETTKRQKTFEKLLKINMHKDYLKQFINIYPFSEKILENIKKEKNNFIEIFKY